MSKFKKREDSKSAGPTLDLHGQRLEGLEDKVDRFLMDSQKKGLHQVRIMTGKGSGQVRVAVEKYLKLGGYPFRFEKNSAGAANEGVLLVQI
jgi:DNA mismatch repair protein MutS2